MYRLLIESFTRPDRNKTFHSLEAAMLAAERQCEYENCSVSVFNFKSTLLYETHTSQRRAA